MAANAQAIHAALVHLGFLMEATVFMQDNQGMGSLEELCLLTDDDIETLFKVTHCPGGTINDPNIPVPQQAHTLRLPTWAFQSPSMPRTTSSWQVTT